MPRQRFGQLEGDLGLERLARRQRAAGARAEAHLGRSDLAAVQQPGEGIERGLVPGGAGRGHRDVEQLLEGLGLADVYLQAAHADFLLDRGRAADVLALLKDRGRADVLLLRLALAAQATQDGKATDYANELFARFNAARLRGDTSHRKEEARALLALRKDAARALPLARDNWAEQREPADARVLLEAALAARDKGAAAPVLKWLADHRVESVQLLSLAGRVGALP